MAKFRTGARVHLVAKSNFMGYEDYVYENKVGHLATVVSIGRKWLTIEWDKPSAHPDGGYAIEDFELCGGPS